MQRNEKFIRFIPLFAAVIVVSGLSFLGGMQYQQSKNTGTSGQQTAIANAKSGLFGSNNADMPDGPRTMFRGAMGQVTTISATSISVKNDRTSENETFGITSDTVITNNGATASAGDIKIGDTVMVRASSSNSKQATRISINPSMNDFDSGPQSGGAGAMRLQMQ